MNRYSKTQLRRGATPPRPPAPKPVPHPTSPAEEHLLLPAVKRTPRPHKHR